MVSLAYVENEFQQTLKTGGVSSFQWWSCGMFGGSSSHRSPSPLLYRLSQCRKWNGCLWLAQNALKCTYFKFSEGCTSLKQWWGYIPSKSHSVSLRNLWLCLCPLIRQPYTTMSSQPRYTAPKCTGPIVCSPKWTIAQESMFRIPCWRFS